MHPTPVLYVEDEENDVYLMRRAFRKAGVANPLQIARDGAEAIRYLEGAGDFAEGQALQMPCLLLLDLNLPKKSGLEILKWVREQPRFKSVPVVILTSSSQDRDIESAYSLGANGYLVKPPSSEKLIELVAALRDTCLGTISDPQTGWLQIKGNIRPSEPIEPS